MSDLNPRFSFETFVVGASNRTAADAARAVAESPGSVYNPLFIYGSTGLGKTHLLQAIGLWAREVADAPEIEFITLEEFVDTLHAATTAGQIEAFRHRYAGVNLLLIDDVQFLTSKGEAQAELLKIIAEMKTAGRQVVVTSDQAAADIGNLDPALHAEFSSGLVVDVTRPDADVRLAILKRRAEERGADFGPGVLEAAAGIELANVRELVGALNRLVAFQAVSESPVTPAAAASMLTDLVPASPAGRRQSVVTDISAVLDLNVPMGIETPAPGGNDDIIKGDMALMPDPPVMPEFDVYPPARVPKSEVPAPAPAAKPAPTPPARRPAAPAAPPKAAPAGAKPAAPPPPAPPARPVPPASPRPRPTVPLSAMPASAPAEPKLDEFAQFLSGVESSVKRSVEAWKARVGQAILRFEGEGYQTSRLGTLLDEGNKSDAEATVRQFEEDVAELQGYENEMAAIDPGTAASTVFRDPDRLKEAAALVERARGETAPPTGPSGAWAFDGFRVGESNQLAYNAALAVVETPGKRYNPLLLVGPPGTGRTHLLHSIGHALAAAPGALVACLSAQDYVDELAQAVDGGGIDHWRSRYRRATAFLLDDAQLLAFKEGPQEELFHLFNHLADAGRQLVLTMTEHPARVDGLDPRIVSRLNGGLVAVVERPDAALRVSLVAKLLTEKLGSADEELADYLGSRPAESVRVLSGAVQRVVRAAEADGVRPTAAFARSVLEEPASAAPRGSTSGVRTSGIGTAPLVAIRSREKVVWRWPNAGERLIEEL